MDAMLAILLRTSFCLYLIFVYLLNNSLAGDYINSAHGNSSIGVKNLKFSEYHRGNCGHCHRQHSEEHLLLNRNPFSLFTSNFNINKPTGNYEQDDNFCFQCHGEPSTQEGSIINYDYARTFAGYPGGPTTILEAFQQASFHNLYDIWLLAKNKFANFFTELSNPCIACHNPHLVKRIKAHTSDPGPYTVISLPTNHDSLWGDDTHERLYSFYMEHYQSPLYFSSSNTYEPGATYNWKGENVPDYIRFCITCHNKNFVIYSNSLNRNLIRINWLDMGGENGPGDKHGKNQATEKINIKIPYNNSKIDIGFVVSCTDCHEPHGSPNIYLIRREVNGLSVKISSTNGNNLGWLCRACHKDDHDFDPQQNLNTWHHVHHGSKDIVDPPYKNPRQCGRCHLQRPLQPIPCINCHMHGKNDSWLLNYNPNYYTGRICF